MKIIKTQITDFETARKKINKNRRIQNPKTRTDKNTTENKSPINPRYYAALNGIKIKEPFSITDFLTDEKGNFDKETAKYIYVYNTNALYETDMETVAKNVKRFISYDKKNKNEVMYTMLALQHSPYYMCKENNDFAEMMELCFDKKHNFDEKRTEVLLQLIDEATEAQSRIDDDSDYINNYDYSCELSERAAKYHKQIIKNYFNVVTDKKDRFDPEKINPKEYFRQNTEKVIFI